MPAPLGSRLARVVVAVATLVPLGAGAQTLRLTGRPAGAPKVKVSTQTTRFGPTPTWTHAGRTITAWSSPYDAVLAPVGGRPTAIQVICADVLNTATFDRTYGVNITSLAGSPTLVDTRWIAGIRVQDAAGATQEVLTNAEALSRYRQASYLGAFMKADNKAQWDDIQLAIWEIMTPFTVRNTTSTSTGTSAQSWLARANAAAARDFRGVSFAGAMVLTDAVVDDGTYRGRPQELQGHRAEFGRQEFVTAAQIVPEPSTWALFGTGLVALVGVSHRRRRG